MKKIDDIIHQREFNSYFRSYTLTTLTQYIWESMSNIYSEIWERYDKEIHKNVYWQSNTLFYLKRNNKYFPIIEPILEKNNIPNDFKYLVIEKRIRKCSFSRAQYIWILAVHEKYNAKAWNGS